MNWARVFERTCKHHDDGHMAKLIRAVKPAGVVSKPVDHLPEFRVKQHMFLLAAVAAIDLSSDVPMIGIQHFDLVRGAGYYSSSPFGNSAPAGPCKNGWTVSFVRGRSQKSQHTWVVAHQKVYKPLGSLHGRHSSNWTTMTAPE